MPWPRPSVLDVLAAECERVSEVICHLDEPSFAIPTRCPPWDVKALFGHMYRDVDRIPANRHQPPDRLFRTFGPTMRLDEYVKTRVLEIAVHGLDLARALDREPWTTPEAEAIVLDILESLLEGDPRASLGWDAIAFIEAGTGRRPFTERERALLGDRVDRFPLLA